MNAAVFLLLVLACMAGMVLSLNRSSPEVIQGEKDRAKWERLNLGPAWGGRG